MKGGSTIKNFNEEKEKTFSRIQDSVKDDVLPTMEIWGSSLSMLGEQKNTSYLREGINHLRESIDILMRVLKEISGIKFDLISDSKERHETIVLIEKTDLILREFRPVIGDMIDVVFGIHEAPSINKERDDCFLIASANILNSAKGLA